MRAAGDWPHLVRLLHLALPAGLAADVARNGGPVTAVQVHGLLELELEQLGRAPRVPHSIVNWLLHAPCGDLELHLVEALLSGLASDVARDGDPVAAVPVNRCLELDQLGLAPSLLLLLATRLVHAPCRDLEIDLLDALTLGLAADVARDGDPVTTVPVNR